MNMLEKKSRRMALDQRIDEQHQAAGGPSNGLLMHAYLINIERMHAYLINIERKLQPAVV